MTTHAISVDGPLPGEPLAELTEALWQRRDDAVACRFIVNGSLPDPTRPQCFLAFLESTPVREGLLGTSQILESQHRLHILSKKALYRLEDMRFETIDAAVLSRDLTRFLDDNRAGVVETFLADADIRSGEVVPRSVASRLAARIASRMRRAHAEPGTTLFRSTRRWAFWVAGSLQFTAVILDPARSNVTIIVVGWDESGVSAWWLDKVAPIPAVEADHSIPLKLASLDVPSPAAASFQASLRLSNPNVRIHRMNFVSPLFHGAFKKIEKRIAEDGLLARLLADSLLRRHVGASEPSSHAVVPRFARCDVDALMQRLARLMEEGGTFSGTRIEPPFEVAATLRGMAREIYGGQSSRALAYVTFDRWSPWFGGILRATSLIIDTASGAITILMLCEAD